MYPVRGGGGRGLFGLPGNGLDTYLMVCSDGKAAGIDERDPVSEEILSVCT